VEYEAGDETVEVVLNGESEQTDDGVSAAMDTSRGTPQACESVQGAPRLRFISVISVFTEITASSTTSSMVFFPAIKALRRAR
jgi:hypothetical protein